MSQLVEIKPHEFSSKTLDGSVLFEWVDDDVFTAEFTVRQVVERENEGAHLNIDHACASFGFEGKVAMTASLVMTEAEARQMHDALGKVLAEDDE